ncbi:M23 family metallopeptidase [bacterium]|nr:M23 family metallopeptidase [bacterium]
MKRLALLSVFLLLLFGAACFFPEQFGTERYVDRTPPSLAVQKNGGTLSLSVDDALNELDSLTLALYQGGQLASEKELDPSSSSHSLSLSQFRKELENGEARLIVTATDNSWWKNSQQEELFFSFDFQRPRLALHSLQHRIYAGGAELIIFEASDNGSLQRVFLTVGEDLQFEAIRLADADARFAKAPELYAVLFAVPRGYPASSFTPELIAHDSFGNVAALPLTIRYVERELRDARSSLSDRFLSRKIPPLIDEMKDGELLEQDAEFSPPEAFRKVNEVFRGHLGSRLSSVIEEQGVRPLIPNGPFVRPMRGTLTSRFGEARTYSYQGEEISHSTHDGQDIASVRGDSVVATSSGTVILSELFGIYGNTVVLDHGLGITSLAGHLSQLSVEVGQVVEKGDEIGRSGETGLAGGDHLHFEIRVQNVPVTPIEWWDKKWFTDNILLKLDDPELLQPPL